MNAKWHAHCQVQLWCTATLSKPDVQVVHEVSSVRRVGRSDFLQMVRDEISARDLASVEKAVVTVISGDDQGRQETFGRLVP